MEPACIDRFQTLFFLATGSLEMSMFHTLSAGKTWHEEPGTGLRAADGRADAGCNAANARTAATTSALPLMPRIIGIRTRGKLSARRRG